MTKSVMLIGAPISVSKMENKKALVKAAGQAVEKVLPKVKKFVLQPLAPNDKEAKKYVAKFMLLTAGKKDTGARVLLGPNVKTIGVLKAKLPPKPKVKKKKPGTRRKPIRVKITCQDCGKERKVYGVNNAKQVPRCTKCQEAYGVQRHLLRMKTKRGVAKLEAFDGETVAKVRKDLKEVDNKTIFWNDPKALTNLNILKGYAKLKYKRVTNPQLILDRIAKDHKRFKEEKLAWLNLAI